ncbi:MAG: o-succinylbenzoate synthase [Actinomycetota bacterium]|nr:o-succinylbenzoate synthase [Actinomycetota bacterium]
MLITFNNRTLQLRTPMVTAHGTTTDRHIIEITAKQDGFFGYGEAAPLPSFGAETLEETQIALTEWSDNPESLPDPPVARSGAAAALDHLRRSMSQISLPPGAVAVQALIGALEISSMERQISDAISDGYRAVKLKVAATDTGSDIERIELAASLIDSRVLLRLDANGGWTKHQALAVLTCVETSRIALVEEPTSDPSDWGKINEETGIRVGADEQLTDPKQIDRLIELEAAQTFVLKPSILGGPPATRSIAALAAKNDIDVVISSFLDGPIALRTARDLALELAPEQIHGLGTAPLFVEDFPEDVRPINGYLHRL